MASQGAEGLVVAALGIFFIAGMRLFLTMGEGLNAAFGLRGRVRWYRAHGISLVLTVSIALLLLTALVLLGGGIQVQSETNSLPKSQGTLQQLVQPDRDL